MAWKTHFRTNKKCPLASGVHLVQLIEYRLDFMTQMFSGDGFPTFLDLQLRSKCGGSFLTVPRYLLFMKQGRTLNSTSMHINMHCFGFAHS